MAPPRRSTDEQDEVELVGVLAEFRTALREELDAARRVAAGAGIQLLNGQLIGQAAEGHQYAFTLESVLNLPEDLPGELLIPGRAPVEATIVSLEGVSITISVPEPLGDFIARASLQSDLTMLLRILIERIEALSTQPNPAGDRLLGETAPSGEPEIVDVDGMNASQAEAVASALGRDTTFIWGPPGTGKTRTIGKIGEQLVRRERSVLVVSHTNSAVDQAILEIVRDLGDDLVDGSVLRLGTPKDQRLVERERLLAETHVKEHAQELLDRQAELLAERAEKTSRLAQVTRLLEIAEWRAQADEEVASVQARERALAAAREEVVVARERPEELGAAAERWHEPAERAEELARKLKEAEPTRTELAQREAMLAPAEQRLHEAERLAREAEALHEEVLATGGIRRRLRGLPRPEEQSAEVGRRRAEETTAREEREAVLARISDVREPLYALDQELEAFKEEHVDTPAGVLEKANAADAAYEEANARAKKLERDADEIADELRSQLHSRLVKLRRWRLTPSRDDDLTAMIGAVESARGAADERLQGVDQPTLQKEQRPIQARLRRIAAELEEIEEDLKHVEHEVIAAATVVATTLTRAYKRESVYARRFDTVILDEASMASIPALWAAAALGDANVVVVGDFKQLAPIKHSAHELAEQWLGRDIFKASGVQDAWEAGASPAHLAQLQVQYRMHPQISAIPNAHFYEGTLEDGEGVDDDGALDGWYDKDWEHDQPVLLIDTAPMNAWVTSVNTAGRASRLNFLSASVCVDLAERLLIPGRPELPLGERARILIASPYRPQTRLTNLLVRDQGLEREVVPGTAHTFQGNEAPVVIFDTVLDEPHFRAGLFVPDYNDGNGRLLNVALTRARRRLIVVGDFTWLHQKAHRHSILRVLADHLREHYPLVSALDVIPAGFAARAAEAHKRIVAGKDAPDALRIVVTQDDYYRILVRDLHHAQSRVVFYSAFLTPGRVGFLEPHLRRLVERGIPTYVITKTIGERAAGQQTAIRIERALADWGVRVLHKLRMHEKLVFIDDDILWSGSLNSLSFTNTQEVMERRVSRAVVEDYARILKLDLLIAAHEGTSPTCPVCGGELVAAEARGGDPFYWRCTTTDCYSRSIDQPAPQDGLLPCASCGGALEFRQMPSGPHWRCTANNRHRQRVIRSHLRLPRMRELIPRRELAQIERDLGGGGEQLRLD